MARVKVNAKSQLEYLRRLSVVWAFPLRLKIVTELYLREMSPKQFFEEFGGGSISRVDKHFKKLAEHGWLRYVRSEGPGGGRRGAEEHFYRATELAVFDGETWTLVPYSMRVAISWTTFKQLAERIRHALGAKTLTARTGSHLGWMTIALDRRGWERVIAAVNELFESIFEEQDDAKLRIRHSGEQAVPATVGLAVFESPSARGDKPTMPGLVRVSEECPVPFTLRVSKAIADELCLKIVEEANLREISVPLFHAELGGDTLAGIRRRFKMAERVGWLKRVGNKTGGRRRGATEHFYKATGPAIFDEEDWAKLPPSIEPPASWTTFIQLGEKVKDSIVAGTFEARLDDHFSWSLLRLDQQGWEKVTAAIDVLLALIFEEWEAAEARIANSDEAAIATTVALAAFESPRKVAREP